ncbi:MAG: ABC transporter permease [Firmicutes bacterium]|nr:ABC transporter permease [Bacillota bacterium]
MRYAGHRGQPFVLAASCLVYLFLMFPMLVILLSSFDTREYMSFPPGGFTLRWYANILNVELFMQGMKTSFSVGILATVLALMLGVPAAYALTRLDFRGKSLLDSILLSPLIVPEIVLGMGLLQILVMVRAFPLYPALLIGHVVIVLPYAIRVTMASLINLGPGVEEAARSLGANGVRAFFRAVLPNIRTGLLAASLLSFITSFNNVPISIFMTGPNVTTLPIQMMIYSEYYFDPTIASISVVMLLLTLLLVYAMERSIGLTYFAGGGRRQ